MQLIQDEALLFTLDSVMPKNDAEKSFIENRKENNK